MEGGCRAIESGGGNLSEANRDALRFRLFEREGGPNCRIFTAFVESGIIGTLGFTAADSLMFCEGDLGFGTATETEQRLGEEITGGGMIGVELQNFAELFSCFLHPAPPEVSSTELEADWIFGRIRCFRFGECLDGIRELILAKESATEQIICCRIAWFVAKRFVGFECGWNGLSCEQISVG